MNRVMFKQFLQANALDFCQIDAARIGGVNEILSVYFMAKKFNGLISSHFVQLFFSFLIKRFSHHLLCLCPMFF